MNIHKITERESKTLDALSNKIYDGLGDRLDISDERRDALTVVAIDTMRKWLQEGR